MRGYFFTIMRKLMQTEMSSQLFLITSDLVSPGTVIFLHMLQMHKYAMAQTVECPVLSCLCMPKNGFLFAHTVVTLDCVYFYDFSWRHG